MPKEITYALLVSYGALVCLLIVDLIVTRRFVRFLIAIGAVIGSGLLLHFTTGFPRLWTQFGGASPVFTIVIVLVSAALGVVARYIFYSRGPIVWRKMLSPLVISPILVLPLVGSVQSSGDVELIQIISFAFLGFQNGFFWRTVVEDAKKTIAENANNEH